MKKKIDINRLRILELEEKDFELVKKYNSWKYLSEEEIRKVDFFNTPDISDYDFDTFDEEDEMYFIAENNKAWFDALKNLEWKENFKKEKEKILKKTREIAKKREEKQILKLWKIRQRKNYNDEKKQVTFRLSTSDIEKIKKMAENEWIPYQTLIWAIIHKIANKKIELILK